ncbi:DUF2267 domain-containing protein [Streptomyces sp. NPDC050388]|uniref:DUF2267 domain-containing protein n=1 Tax=Streptomyces sp. NPDC050388 TaxID=3155781 RepID=UPI0034372121
MTGLGHGGAARATSLFPRDAPSTRRPLAVPPLIELLDRFRVSVSRTARDGGAAAGEAQARMHGQTAKGRFMSATRSAGSEHAVHTANIRLKAVSEVLGIEDRHLAERVLRTWLHTLRDRPTVDVVAHFGAQLPELLRGVHYGGWDPSIVPAKYGREEYGSRPSRKPGSPLRRPLRSPPQSPPPCVGTSHPDSWGRQSSSYRTTSELCCSSRPPDRARPRTAGVGVLLSGKVA